jgi:hypothetical protein
VLVLNCRRTRTASTARDDAPNARRYFGIHASLEGPGILDSTRRAIRNQNDLAEEQPAFQVPLDKLCGETRLKRTRYEDADQATPEEVTAA